jgi:hypothetical protein
VQLRKQEKFFKALRQEVKIQKSSFSVVELCLRNLRKNIFKENQEESLKENRKKKGRAIC